MLEPEFRIHLSDCGAEDVRNLSREHLTFLDESLKRSCHEAVNEIPKFPYIPRISTRDSQLLDSCRIQVESYLRAVLDSPHCIICPELWIVLGLPPESHIVPRFLIRRDNMQEVLDLSGRPDQLFRVSSTAVLSTILRLLEENPFNLSIQSTGLTALLRVLANLPPDQTKLVTDTRVLASLFRILSSGTLLVHLVRPVLLAITEYHTNAMFVYFQRDGGLVESAELAGSELPLLSLQIIAEAIYSATRFSNDVCIAISDKSSVGVSVLNKLLARGRGTMTEVIVTVTLVNLLRKGFISEYKDKISKVIFSIVSAQKFFLESNFFCPYKLANSTLHGPVIDDALIQFGCYLVTNRALNAYQLDDPEWAFVYDESGLGNFQKRLIQLLVTGTSLTESSRATICETFLVSSQLNLRIKQIEDLSDIFTQVKIWNKNFSWKIFLQKSNIINNYLIEINFQISSKSAGVQMDDLMAIQTNLDAIAGEGRLKRILQKISQQLGIFEKHHKLLVDKVLSTMNQARQVMAQTNVVRNKLTSALTISDGLKQKCDENLVEIDVRLKKIAALVARKEELEFEQQQATAAIQEKKQEMVPLTSDTVTEDSRESTEKFNTESDISWLEERLKILTETEIPKMSDNLMKERSSLDEFVCNCDLVKLLESVSNCFEEMKKIFYEIAKINSVIIPQFVTEMESLDQSIADIHQLYRTTFREELFRVKNSLENVIDIVEETSNDTCEVAGGFITPDEN